MGFFKDQLEKLQKAAKKDDTPKDPEAEKAAEREKTKKNFERLGKLMDWAKKGGDQYNKAAKKAGDLKDAAIEKVKPVAEKLDGAAETVKGATETVKDVTGDAIVVAKGKLEDFKDAQDKKPSTGSGLLDILTPAVPETDATKSRKDRTEEKKNPDAPKPPSA